MRQRCKASWVAVAAFVATVAAVVTVVRAWRRDRAVMVGRALPLPVDDRQLTDRVCTALGAAEASLDVPHVHVTVERGVVLLHGDVPDRATEHLLLELVRGVHGVRQVTSLLHVGLLPGDSRPSSGGFEESDAAARLRRAAVRAGGGEHTGELAARAVLASFGRALPRTVRRRVESHVPHDVGAWLEAGEPMAGWKTMDELYADVAARAACPPAHVPWVVDAVLRELRALVPDDAEAVALQLPPSLRHLWRDVGAAA